MGARQPASGPERHAHLHVKAEAAADGKDHQIAWPISAGARTADPQIFNNSALLGLVVLGKAVAQPVWNKP